MAQYFRKQYLKFGAFRNGEIPTVRADAYEKYLTLSELQKNRELEVDGQFAADLTAICEGNTVQGVMMQVFNLHDKSSTLFTLNAKDGVIDWEELHAIVHMHMHGTLQNGHIQMSPVSVDTINTPNKFAQMIADRVCEKAGLSAHDGFHFRAEVARHFDESNAKTEAQRVQESLQKALHILPKDAAQTVLMARMEIASELTRPIDIMSWQCAEFSDKLSLDVREAWIGNFSELQQQPGISFDQALWLGGLQAVTPFMAGFAQQVPWERLCTEEDRAVFTFMQAGMIEQARNAGCTEQKIADAMSYAIKLHATTYSPTPDKMIMSSFESALYQAVPMSEVRFNDYWDMGSDASELIKKHLTGDPHISPAQDFRTALMTATPEIEKMMRETYGVAEPHVPDMNAVYKEIDFTHQCNVWIQYAEFALAELPRDQAQEFLQMYQHNITMANVTSDISNTGTLALQMYKTAHDYCKTHSVPIAQELAMAGIRTSALSDALANGITPEQLHAAEGRDELGDDDISDDAF